MPITVLDTRDATTSARDRRLKRAPWHHFLEAVLAIFSVALLLEGIFYLAGIGDQEYLRPNPLTGYSPMEGKHVTWRQEGFSRSIFNSLAMRDKERTIAKPGNCFRIAVLGDSYTEALQVEREHSFCQLAEDNLNASSKGLRFEVMNFGVSAYNLGQMYLRLKHLAAGFKPDIVILAVRIDQPPQLDPNPHGGFLFARPTFRVDGRGALVQDDSLQKMWNAGPEGRRISATSWSRQNSRLWGVISLCAQKLSRNKKDALSDYHEHSAQQQWTVAHALIAACKSVCEKTGGRLVVLALPGPGQLHNLEQLKLLRDSSTTLKIPFLDLTPAFAAASKINKDLYFVCHMTDKGHRLLADELTGFLKRECRLSALP